MSTPILEYIADNINTAIGEITTANGYNETLVPLRATRQGMTSDGTAAYAKDKRVLIVQETPEEAEELSTEGNPRMIAWRQPFTLVAFLIDDKGSTAALDTRKNKVKADIQKKLMVDPSRGGYAIQTYIRPYANFAEGSEFSGVALVVEVLYRVNEVNPYIQTSEAPWLDVTIHSPYSFLTASPTFTQAQIEALPGEIAKQPIRAIRFDSNPPIGADWWNYYDEFCSLITGLLGRVKERTGATMVFGFPGGDGETPLTMASEVAAVMGAKPSIKGALLSGVYDAVTLNEPRNTLAISYGGTIAQAKTRYPLVINAYLSAMETLGVDLPLIEGADYGDDESRVLPIDDSNALDHHLYVNCSGDPSGWAAIQAAQIAEKLAAYTSGRDYMFEMNVMYDLGGGDFIDTSVYSTALITQLFSLFSATKAAFGIAGFHALTSANAMTALFSPNDVETWMEHPAKDWIMNGNTWATAKNAAGGYDDMIDHYTS